VHLAVKKGNDRQSREKHNGIQPVTFLLSRPAPESVLKTTAQ
jgi:hypothetical protein